MSHELVHHAQNCRGDLSGPSIAGAQGYAQKDSHLRGLESDAYERGNMVFRDWEDGYKNAVLESIYKYQQILRRNKTMEIHAYSHDPVRIIGKHKGNEAF